MQAGLNSEGIAVQTESIEGSALLLPSLSTPSSTVWISSFIECQAGRKFIIVILLDMRYEKHDCRFSFRPCLKKKGNSMKLIIVRHAAAIERAADISEGKRYLTPEGRLFFRKTARTISQQGINPTMILASPLIRAVQTADILVEAVSYCGPLVVADELAPGFDKSALQNLLNTFQPLKELVIIGHEPDLSLLIASFLSLSDGFNFKKGAAVKLNIDAAVLAKPAIFKWLAVGNKLVTNSKEAFGR